jgi:translation elongation factor EF-Tu-like GTPase
MTFMAGYAEVWVSFLSTEQGGRRTPVNLGEPSPGHYRPHFRVRGGDGEMLGVEFVDGPNDWIQPGNSAYATVRFLWEPGVSYDRLVSGTEFDVLEGSRVVGAGHVTRR